MTLKELLDGLGRLRFCLAFRSPGMFGPGEHGRRNFLTYSTLFILRNKICCWKHGFGCHEFVIKKPFVVVSTGYYVKAKIFNLFAFLLTYSYSTILYIVLAFFMFLYFVFDFTFSLEVFNN